VAPTRLHYAEELDRLEQQTIGGIDLVVEQLDRTMEALTTRDRELAEMVVMDDDRIDGRYVEVHQGLLSLIALQAPVATDLRRISAMLDVIRHIERMGDQCVNIAKLIPLAGEPPERDGGMLERIAEMGDRVRALIRQAGQAFAGRDEALALQLVQMDDDVDRLNREMFPLALELAADPDGREWAMRMVQVARWLERIGDYAVDIGEQAAFVITGQFQEFEDASHPQPAAGAGHSGRS
jgi:phosphate transport system protein